MFESPVSVTELRRELHRYPEYGWCEYRTTARLAGLLGEAGYEIFYLSDLPEVDLEMLDPSVISNEAEKRRAVTEGADPGTVERLKIPGFIARLETGRQGIRRGLRCDIDAVGVSESTDPDHLPFSRGFSSLHPGLCHSCGHDGHMALAVSAAIKLAEIRDRLNGTITFIFQPAEEGCRGARALTNVSLINSLDELYGFHLGICAENGEIVINPTDFLSSVKFDVEITGKSAHAGIEPEKGINALKCACRIADKLFALPDLHPGAKFNIGKFRSENARNVICDRATFECECRCSSSAETDVVFEAADKIIRSCCEATGCKYKIHTSGTAVEILNSPELREKIRTAALRSDLNIIETRPFRASEDCGHLIRAVQNNGGLGAYVVLGNSISSGHHSPEFDLSEEGLPMAAEFLFNLMKAE